MTGASPRPVYFDCDTGVDDALALLFLLGRPSVELRGIGTVSGNVDARQAARNTLDLLALAGRGGIPVGVGAVDHLTSAYRGGVPHIHGRNGIGDIALPRGGAPSADSAADLLIRLAREHAGELEVIAVGPLTNLALALEREPGLPQLIRRVTIMGGAALAPGNLTAAAEANIGNDPEAADAVFAAAWPVVMVGLDVTMQHRLTERDRTRLLGSDRPVARAVGAMLDTYFAFHVASLGARGSALHDPLAVAVATGDAVPDLAPVIPVRVDTGGSVARGATVCDLRGLHAGFPPVDGARHTVVLRIDEPFAPTLMDALLAL